MFASACQPFSMVKRSCPFNDDMNPQMKIHVRDKEVAKGVMSDQHMKLVYDKTKHLLFLGAKKTQAAPASNTFLNGGEAKEDVVSSNSTTFKQMQLTSQGQLSSPEGAQTPFKVKEAPCSKCTAWNPLDMCCCSFCDTPLCSSCTQICTKCQDLFCSGCSFDVYDASEGFICRNCC
ncbi:apoptosis regulatory protein Siva-like [Thrips palmi]|uniref:Apoptosis regulatory protein Siva-like n=1 Tax=Thrips palmi TaxID=161013 RepID=A0A6P8ZVF3_THRPL|nr:apoptosis regulatory protein Siva-like [Thrips palmi]